MGLFGKKGGDIIDFRSKTPVSQKTSSPVTALDNDYVSLSPSVVPKNDSLDFLNGMANASTTPITDTLRESRIRARGEGDLGELKNRIDDVCFKLDNLFNKMRELERKLDSLR